MRIFVPDESDLGTFTVMDLNFSNRGPIGTLLCEMGAIETRQGSNYDIGIEK